MLWSGSWHIFWVGRGQHHKNIIVSCPGLVTRLPGPPTTHMLCYKDSKFNCSPGVTSGHCEQLSPCYPANLTNIISFCQSIFYTVSSIFCHIFCSNDGMRFMFQTFISILRLEALWVGLTINFNITEMTSKD